MPLTDPEVQAVKDSACFVWALTGARSNADVLRAGARFVAVGDHINAIGAAGPDPSGYEGDPAAAAITEATKAMIAGGADREFRCRALRAALWYVLRAQPEVTLDDSGSTRLYGYFSRDEDPTPMHMWLYDKKAGAAASTLYDTVPGIMICAKSAGEHDEHVYHPAYERDALDPAKCACITLPDGLLPSHIAILAEENARNLHEWNPAEQEADEPEESKEQAGC